MSDFTDRMRNTARYYDRGGIMGDAISKCVDRIEELETRLAGDQDERVRVIADRLYRRLDVIRRSSELLPETPYEDGFWSATQSELAFLEELLSEIELIG